MNEIFLLGKKILLDKSPVVLSYQPDENWPALWDAKGGSWRYEDGYLIGSEPENKGGILLSKQRFDKDVMFSFTMASVLPATRDLNAVYCTTWDDDINYLKKSYISGLNGWYEGKSGIERFHIVVHTCPCDPQDRYYADCVFVAHPDCLFNVKCGVGMSDRNRTHLDLP